MRKRTSVALCMVLVMAMSCLVTASVRAAGKYAGLAKCAQCHKGMHNKLYTNWEKTKHARSYKDMVAKYPASAKDPVCLGCHTTGHGAGGFDPANPATEADFGGVTCEGCHGPCGDHVANPVGSKPSGILCHKCHFGPPQEGTHKHHIQLHGKK